MGDCTPEWANRYLTMSAEARADSLRTSSLRHPRQPHALGLTFASGKVSRIITVSVAGTRAANCKLGIERKPCLHRRSRFVHVAEPRKDRRELEMRGGVISVC